MVQQHPDWNDERIYQTVKLVMGAKVALIGNSYQMAYWLVPIHSVLCFDDDHVYFRNDKMPWPRDDGFPL